MSTHQDSNNSGRRDFLRALSGGALALASGSLLAGCGGAGNSSGSTGKAGAAPSGTTAPGGTTAPPAITGSARATVHITWPKPKTAGSVRSRLIPAASNAIKIDIKNGATPVASAVIATPSPSHTFDALPVGSLTVICTAYPDATAAGVAQAVGTGTLVTQAGQTAALTVTMDSTVDHLSIAPVTAPVSVGATTQLAVTAYDAAGAIVLLSPSKLQWQSSDTSVATVDGSGVVTGMANGTAGITVTDAESQKTSSPVTVTVTDANNLSGNWVAWYGDNSVGNPPGGIQLSLSEDTDGNVSGSILFNHARESGDITGKRTGTQFQLKTIYPAPTQFETLSGSIATGGTSAAGTITGYGGDLNNQSLPFKMVRDGQPVPVILWWQGGGASGTVTLAASDGTPVAGSGSITDGKGELTTSLPSGDYRVILNYTSDRDFGFSTNASGTVALTPDDGYFRGSAGSGTDSIDMRVD